MKVPFVQRIIPIWMILSSFSKRITLIESLSHQPSISKTNQSPYPRPPSSQPQPQPYASKSKSKSIRYLPSQIQINELSQSYPTTFLRTLFSSIPQREFALHNVTTHFGLMAGVGVGDGDGSSSSSQGKQTKEAEEVKESQMTLLVGASSSGKSTLLRLLAGLERPTHGQIFINGYDVTSKETQTNTRDDGTLVPTITTTTTSSSALETLQKKKIHFYPKPIIVDRKPSMTSLDDSKTVLYWIQQSSCIPNQFTKNTHIKLTSEQIQCIEEWVETLAHDFAQIFTLTKEQLIGKPSQLTPSGQFLFGLACACMKSISDFVIPTTITSNYINSTITNHTSRLVHVMSLSDLDQTTILNSFFHDIHMKQYGPILLLDELLDFEHSSIVQQVDKGLQRLVERGGIVICATHKPHYFCKNEHDIRKRVLTLSAGTILTDT